MQIQELKEKVAKLEKDNLGKQKVIEQLGAQVMKDAD